MKLQDALNDAVSDVSADLPTLVVDSRRRGLALRRRRAALSVVGTAAAVLAVVGGAYAVSLHDPGETRPEEPRFASAPPLLEPDASVPITGPGTVAALRASVDEVADGEFAGYRGQGPYDRDPSTRADDDVFGELLFAPASGGPAAAVQVNLQDLGILDECDGTRRTCEPPSYDCSQAFLEDCAVRTLPGGDVLRTYVDRSSGSDAEYERRVAELLSPDRQLRIVVSASNTSASEKDVVRDEPVLTRAQLAAIAQQPWWDLAVLPEVYVDAGAVLPSYEDLGARAEDQQAPTPSD